MIFKFIKNIISNITSLIQLELNVIYDYWNYKRYYSRKVDLNTDKKSLESWIIQDKHRLEKGLSLPSPRLAFGKQVIKRLIKNLVIFAEKYPKNDVYYFGVGSLLAYKEYHLSKQGDLPEFFISLISIIDKLDFENSKCDQVGVANMSTFNIENKSVYREFLMSRHSCRDFDNDMVISNDILKDIMELSIKAPSVCNRQHWHVYFFTANIKKQVLSFQNGNSGFADNIPYIAAITSDIRAFYTPDERNQAYTDGGIFAMNFMYATQSLGLNSCALNWSNSFLQEIRFKKLELIKPYHTIVTLIAFGYPNKEGVYAKSPRLPISNFYSFDKFTH